MPSSFPRSWTKRLGQLLHGRRRASRVAGYFDEARDGAARGWAWDRTRPEKRLLVDIFVNDRFVGQQLANKHRPDLRSRGIGDGRYAFELPLSAPTRPGEDLIRAFVLAEGGERVELPSSSEERKTTRVRFGAAEDYLRATFAALLAEASAPGPDARFFIEPAPKGARIFDRLFAASPIAGPPPMLGRTLCGYLDHNRFKWDIAHLYDTTVSREDYAAFLKHYVEDYGRARRPLRIPLAASDIAFLTQGPTRAQPLLPSLGQRLLGGSLDAEAGGAATFESVYRWAIYESRALGVEDCLVAAPQVELLSSLDAGAAQPYPLSRFMKRFLAENAFLSRIDTRREDGRRLAYLSVLLFSLTSPHYLRYVPDDGLDAFLAPAETGATPFGAALQSVFGALAFDARAYRAWMSRRGFDWAKKTLRALTPRGDRLQAASVPIANATRVDVQLIGPFSRQLGIAESCRTLADALQRLDGSLRLCDFTLDYPNRARPHAGHPLSEPGRARINILHLNLEELPSAIAYLPDVFTGSHVIAFPYLELPSPTPAQTLGLTLVDEIWSASDFMTRALAPFAPTHTVGTARPRPPRLGRAAARRRAYGTRVAPDDFVFLTSCDALSGACRKNPLGAARAFLAAFPDDASARLVVKVHSLDRVGASAEGEIWRRLQNLAAQSDRILLIDRLLDDDEHMALIEGADCFVSLHRAEGFGYHMLEAMMLETPVLATAYSGNMDFCNDRTAFLVPYETVLIERGQYPRVNCGQTWAEPDFAASVAMMRRVRGDAAAREGVVKAAKELSAARYSLSAFSRRLEARLAPLLAPSRAERIFV